MLLLVVKPRVEIWSVNYCFISDASIVGEQRNGAFQIVQCILCNVIICMRCCCVDFINFPITFIATLCVGPKKVFILFVYILS